MLRAAAMSAELWRRGERLLSTRRAQVVLLLGLLLGFVLFRWAQRLEPWNTDDMTLFQLSEDAASGHHWLFGTSEQGSFAGERLPHLAFRIGLLPVSIPLIEAFGAHATAYYLVPLVFALLGFAALYWAVFSHFGPLVALLVAVVHVAWPFELAHGSEFLSDLPSASAALASLCLLHAAGQRTGTARVACALLAGLAALECQLSRNNALVLLAPALLVLLWSRPTRLPSVWAGAVVLVGMLATQGLLIYRGLGWGYDWTSVRADFADYTQFFPVYSWPEFFVRQFRYQVSAFGFGVTGALAAVLVLASLLGHVLLLRFERRPLLLAIALFGLFTWLVFSFSIYEFVPGGVRAMSPVNFRFVQPFTYSSLVVWAWLWCALRSSTRALPRLASLALPLLLVTFSYVASIFHLPTIYRQSGTRRLVRAIEQLGAKSAEPLLIAGTNLRVPRRFCCAGPSHGVEWRELSAPELGQVVASRSRALVLRDMPRDLRSARYLEPEARRAYRAELARLEETLWQDYELEYVDTKYALFAAPRRSDTGSTDVTRSADNVPSAVPPGRPLLDEATCSVSPEAAPAQTAPADGADTWRTLVPIHAGPRRALCEYTWLTDGLVVPAPDPAHARAEGAGFVARLGADYESPLSLAVDVVEQTGRGLRRQQVELLPGTSYVPVPVHDDTRRIFLVYRLRTRGASAEQVVRVRPAQWRTHAFGGAGEGSFEAPAGDAPQ
jgi:hypothetical protein